MQMVFCTRHKSHSLHDVRTTKTIHLLFYKCSLRSMCKSEWNLSACVFSKWLNQLVPSHSWEETGEFPIFNLHLQWTKSLIWFLFELSSIYGCVRFVSVCRSMCEPHDATKQHWPLHKLLRVHHKCRHALNFVDNKSHRNGVQMDFQ